MFSRLRNNWSQAGVNSTLLKLGFEKQVARAITASLPHWTWNMLNDCTKGLNVPHNLCNTIYALTIYENIHNTLVSDYELHEDISYAFKNLLAALDYQGEMGSRAHIDESQRRFEYAAERHFDSLGA